MKLRSGKIYYENKLSDNISINTKPATVQSNFVFVSANDKYKKKINIIKNEIEIKLNSIIESNIVPTIQIDKHKGCCICSERYKKNDLICSCDIKNVNKHSYHRSCLKSSLKPYIGNDGSNINIVPQCPYCCQKINYKNIKSIKII